MSPDVRDAYFGSLDKAFEGFTFVDDSAAQYMTKAAGGGGASGGNNHNNRYVRDENKQH